VVIFYCVSCNCNKIKIKKLKDFEITEHLDRNVSDCPYLDSDSNSVENESNIKGNK